MLNGIIFVKETIISLDLQYTLSKYYKIVNVFKNIEEAPLNVSDIDFIIIDTDPYSEQELRSILDKLNIKKDVKIISITSHPTDLKSYSYIHTIPKPYDFQSLLEAIEQSKHHPADP